MKLATLITLALFTTSFFLPVGTGIYTVPFLGDRIDIGQISGFQIARALLFLPFTDFPRRIVEAIELLIAWPANFLVVFTFLSFLLDGRFAKYAPYTANAALVSQLIWLVEAEFGIGTMFPRDVGVGNFGIGYWAWLASGICLWSITIFVLPHRAHR